MPQKFKSTAFVLCFFLGLIAAHRFYLARPWSAAIQGTFGLCGIALLAIGVQRTVFASVPGSVAQNDALLVLAGCLALTIWSLWWLVDKILLLAGLLTDGRGRALRTGAPDPSRPQAGFWIRLAAFITDYLIVGIGGAFLSYLVLLLSLLRFGLRSDAEQQPMLTGLFVEIALDPHAFMSRLGDTQNWQLDPVYLTVLLPSFLVGCLYYTVLTRSSWQGTIGKRAFGIQVVCEDGRRMTWSRSLWRYLCFLLACLPLYLGLALAACTTSRRALHDFLAATRVIHTPPPTAQATPWRISQTGALPANRPARPPVSSAAA